MLKHNLQYIRGTLPEAVTLICVSKFHSPALILEAYNLGERDFGESRVQELLAKQQQLPRDIRWHFIGHLQKNKVKAILPFVHLIHGVDTAELLGYINQEALRLNLDHSINLLLEVHVATEQTKYGFTSAELRSYIDSGQWQALQAVRICGIMGMASLTDDEQQIGREFNELHQLFLSLKHNQFASQPQFNILSMGMSDDYPIAIAQGSNMVRIGTAIFGQRQY